MIHFTVTHVVTTKVVISNERDGLLKHLYAIPQKKYILQSTSYDENINKSVKMIDDADMILIGGGAGLSITSELIFSGKRFTDNFSDFIEKYGNKNMTDIYMKGFYPFKTEEEYWAYWSRLSFLNRIYPDALKIYQELYELIKDKDHFVITTNADAQFSKAGFKDDNIFATQGDFSLIQCSKACHDKTYEATDIFKHMRYNIKNCKIPSTMLPKCPVCGSPMEMNLRNNDYFVEDEQWHRAERNYGLFLNRIGTRKIVLIELGVGFNTPIIIRFPFEKMSIDRASAYLIRLNLDQAEIPENLKNRATGIKGDIAKSLHDIYKNSTN